MLHILIKKKKQAVILSYETLHFIRLQTSLVTVGKWVFDRGFYILDTESLFLASLVGVYIFTWSSHACTYKMQLDLLPCLHVGVNY